LNDKIRKKKWKWKEKKRGAKWEKPIKNQLNVETPIQNHLNVKCWIIKLKKKSKKKRTEIKGKKIEKRYALLFM